MDKLKSLQYRLLKIGIRIEYRSNVPWVYLWKVNDKVVEERFLSSYGYTVAIISKGVDLVDIGHLFKTIRRYT